MIPGMSSPMSDSAGRVLVVMRVLLLRFVVQSGKKWNERGDLVGVAVDREERGAVDVGEVGDGRGKVVRRRGGAHRSGLGTLRRCRRRSGWAQTG